MHEKRMNFSGSSVVKNPSASAGDRRDAGSISGFKKFPEGGNGNPFQYACLDKHMDRGAWRAIVHGIARVSHLLSMHTHVHRL